MARTSHGGRNGGGSGCCGKCARRRPRVAARPARAAATGTAAAPTRADPVARRPLPSLPVPIPTPPVAATRVAPEAACAAVAPGRTCPGAAADRPRARLGPPPDCGTRPRAGRVPDRRRSIGHQRLPARCVVRLIRPPDRQRVIGLRRLPASSFVRRSATRRRARRREPSPRKLRRVLAPLAACVATLGPRQERVLVRRAGLRGFKGASRVETAASLHLSVRRVARLEHRALRTLRRKARAGACDAPEPASVGRRDGRASMSLPAPAAPAAAAPRQEVKAVQRVRRWERRGRRRKRTEAPQRGTGGRGRGRRAGRAQLCGRAPVPVRARRARDPPVRAAVRARAASRGL